MRYDNSRPRSVLAELPRMEKIGRYKIIGELGRGAMGVVYKAQDPAINRLIAIKSIRLDTLADESERERMRERLFREAQSAGILSHPGIVTIYDIAEENDMAYIFMELVNGPPLEKLLKNLQRIQAVKLRQERGDVVMAGTTAGFFRSHVDFDSIAGRQYHGLGTRKSLPQLTECLTGLIRAKGKFLAYRHRRVVMAASHHMQFHGSAPPTDAPASFAIGGLEPLACLPNKTNASASDKKIKLASVKYTTLRPRRAGT